jgi:hypothetical protein
MVKFYIFILITFLVACNDSTLNYKNKQVIIDSFESKSIITLFNINFYTSCEQTKLELVKMDSSNKIRNGVNGFGLYPNNSKIFTRIAFNCNSDTLKHFMGMFSEIGTDSIVKMVSKNLSLKPNVSFTGSCEGSIKLYTWENVNYSVCLYSILVDSNRNKYISDRIEFWIK